MEHYSILSQSPADLEAAATANLAIPPSLTVSREILRFPGEDGGRSLAQMAERDLDAALRLLAERAQYITAASGSLIGFLRGNDLICCASSGTASLQVGMDLAAGSGLSVEAARSGQMLRCDDARNDPRVNQGSCRTLGVASAMAMPLRRGEAVVGVFELVSGKVRAFEEHDVSALQRLGEMVQTAVEHAEAAKRAAAEIDYDQPTGLPELEVRPLEAQCDEELGAADAPELAASDAEAATPLAERGNIGKCEACGFPVSAGRHLCLDCEASSGNPVTGPNASVPHPATTATALPPSFSMAEPEPGWLQSHKYFLGVLLVGLLAAAAVLCFR